jgi:hypothetical protein
MAEEKNWGVYCLPDEGWQGVDGLAYGYTESKAKEVARGLNARDQRKWEARPLSTAWRRIEPTPPPRCDICDMTATWEHPMGGLRCDACPRPEK